MLCRERKEPWRKRQTVLRAGHRERERKRERGREVVVVEVAAA